MVVGDPKTKEVDSTRTKKSSKQKDQISRKSEIDSLDRLRDKSKNLAAEHEHATLQAEPSIETGTGALKLCLIAGPHSDARP